MADTIISVERLGKKYQLAHQSERSRYKTLRDAITFKARDVRNLWPLRNGNNGSGEVTREEFWALKDVSFEVKRGEVLGVIGRNGAGKSTLLKILSRITEPTRGRVRIRGRVASLLEVGTGFHPELTGRENVFLNGAILGMSKAEIKRKFDEIVAFAEVEKFLDTPVKRYSSGMYVRLAFAVAAHLEPEILIVDEVLAVGDMQFQKKCLGKMQDVSTKEGRTVLFVSHNLAAIRSLCGTGLFLKNGQVALWDEIGAVTAAYTNPGESDSFDEHSVKLPKAPDQCDTWMESVSVLCNGIPSTTFHFGDRISFKVKFKAHDLIQRPLVGYLIRSARGEDAVNANNYFLPSPDFSEPVMEGEVICDLGALPLMAGSYSVSFWFGRTPYSQHHVQDVLKFTVEERDIWGSGKLPARSLSCLWWTTDFAFLRRE
jgi:lipopolysaccharide transport system ATP-binding protein